MRILRGLIIVLSIALFFLVSLIFLDSVHNSANQTKEEFISHLLNKIIHSEEKSSYIVYEYDRRKKEFSTLSDAIKYAEQLNRAYIIQNNSKKWIWDNFNQFIVYSNETYLDDFESFKEAYGYAKFFQFGKIYYENLENLVWNKENVYKERVLLDVPVFTQLPDLQRGCEVTALSMLLHYVGKPVDKMELASKIKKDHTPYRVENDKIYYGNPNNGFIGDMVSIKNPGYGVYHQPIYELLSQYLPTSSVDLTGSTFDELLFFLNQKIPIWIITNSTFKPLSDEEFETWETPNGVIEVTMREHAVVVTGYDDNYIYFNNPLKKEPNQREKKDDFIEAWIQMGRQAVTYLPYIEK